MRTDDFLQIIDFVKNDDKYTKRIKELQDLEDSLKSKLAVAKTVEAAQKLEKEAEDYALTLVDQKKAADAAYAKRSQDLEDQYKAKVKNLDEKGTELAKRAEQVAKTKEEALAAMSKAEATLADAGAKLNEANMRLDQAGARESKTNYKLARLKALAEE
jgi:DNA repair exonuclease SbcCD ATPase subunit